MKDIHINCRIVNGHHFDEDDVCKKCGKAEIDLRTGVIYTDHDDDIVHYKLRWCPQI